MTAFYSFHIPFTLKHLWVIICVRLVSICFCVVCIRALILSTRHAWWKSWRTQRVTGEEAGIAWPALSTRAALRPARKWVWAWNGMGWVQIHYSWVNFDDLSGATWSFQNRHSKCGLVLNRIQINKRTAFITLASFQLFMAALLYFSVPVQLQLGVSCSSPGKSHFYDKAKADCVSWHADMLCLTVPESVVTLMFLFLLLFAWQCTCHV